MSEPNSIDFVRCMRCDKIMKCSRYNVAALLNHIRNYHPEIEIIDTDTKRKRHFYKAPKSSTPNSSTRQKNKIQDNVCSPEGCDLEKPLLSASAAHLESPVQVKDVDLSHYSATSEILAKYPEIKECEYAPHNPNAQVAYTRRYKLSTPSALSVSVLQQPFQHTLYRTSIEKWCPANGSIYCPKCGSHKRPLIKTKAERLTHNDCGACCLLSCWPFCFIPWILPGQNQEYLYCANCKTFLGLYDRQRNCLKPNRLYITSGSNRAKHRYGDMAKMKPLYVSKTKLLEDESPPPQSLATSTPKSARLSSIIVNGKKLSPEAVARIEKYKRFGSLVGIDLNALTADDSNSNSNRRQVAHEKETEIAAPPVEKEN